jgi:hypothetical protein
MKTVAVGVCLVLSFLNVNAQSEKPANQVIEGGKVVVELIKVLRGKKDIEKSSGCKGSYADLCVLNESSTAISVSLVHRGTNERREMIIQPHMQDAVCRLLKVYGLMTSVSIPTPNQSVKGMF